MQSDASCLQIRALGCYNRLDLVGSSSPKKRLLRNPMPGVEGRAKDTLVDYSDPPLLTELRN